MPAMCVTWRNPLPAALAAALLFSASPAAALDQAALEELETLLRDLGFDPGKVDGVVDDDTIAAIRRYQEFAVLPGEPAPSEKLLNELRGVAAAFAALSAGKEEAPAAPATTLPEPGAGPPDAAGQKAPQTAPPAPAAEEKVIVPPPPPPPKLRPEEVAEQPAEKAAATGKTEEDEAEPQVAEVPPADRVETDAQEPNAEKADAEKADAQEAEPVDEAQARIDAELVPYRGDLDEGRITRAALARQFNDEGRQALQRADYGAAVLKFSVAIHLDPDFAGAYSNRGTAYQRQEETELAAADFAKAKELGFGGFRLRDGKSPFN